MLKSRRITSEPFWQKLPQSNEYPLPGGACLFGPTEDMWDVHDAATPTAVAARAGLGPRLWEYWKTQYGESRPWLFDWLYNYRDKIPDDAPRGISADMRAFRKQASISAITASAVRSNERVAAPGSGRRGQHVSDEMIPYWLKKHQKLPWLKHWLLRGQKPPDNVTIPTKDEIARCRKAWDLRRLVRSSWHC